MEHDVWEAFEELNEKMDLILEKLEIENNNEEPEETEEFEVSEEISNPKPKRVSKREVDEFDNEMEDVKDVPDTELDF